jgi:hypothetical protein
MRLKQNRVSVILAGILALTDLCCVSGSIYCFREPITIISGLCKNQILANNYCVEKNDSNSSTNLTNWISEKKTRIENFTKETCFADVTESCRGLTENSSIEVMEYSSSH